MKIRPSLQTHRKFTATAKKRWFGRFVTEVLVSEFRQISPEFMKSQISNGKVYLNGSIIKEDRVFMEGDVLEHHMIIREPPVYDLPVVFLGSKNTCVGTIFAFEKPPGIPVHPGGRFFSNSLTEIIKKREFDSAPSIESSNSEALSSQKPLYRLDRLSSGLVLFGDSKAANSFRQLLESRTETLAKLYILRVANNFNKNAMANSLCFPCQDALGSRRSLKMSFHDAAREYFNINYQSFSIQGFMQTENKKSGRQSFHSDKTGLENPKFSESTATMLAYNEDKNESLILASPGTGRTHQLRVHFSSIQCPITNDKSYTSDSQKISRIQSLPPIPHENLPGSPDSSGDEHGLPPLWHQSGICLHSLAYCLKDEYLSLFVSSTPPWAKEMLEGVESFLKDPKVTKILAEN